MRSLILPLILTLIVSGIVFGGLGYNLGKNSKVIKVSPQASNQKAPVSQIDIPNGSADTSAWKTYNYQSYDKTWGFTIKYPDNWALDSHCNFPLPKDFIDKRTDTRDCSPFSWAADDNTTIADFYKPTTASQLQPIRLANGTQAEVSLEKDSSLSPYFASVYNYLFKIGSNVVLITVPETAGNGLTLDHIKEAAQIVNSFKGQLNK